MNSRFYQWAPFVLGVACATYGLGCYVLGSVFGANEAWLFWFMTSTILTLGGIFIGLSLKRLNIAANTDELTGLKNRRYANMKITEELKRKNLIITVALVDVDNFKAVNDLYGHPYGDTFLIELAEIIKQTVRQTDIVIRWGGDEFLIIFSQTGIDAAVAIMERLRKTVEETYSYEQVTLSIGVTSLDLTTDLQGALPKVDRVLYQAKGSKNMVFSMSPGVKVYPNSENNSIKDKKG